MIFSVPTAIRFRSIVVIIYISQLNSVTMKKIIVMLLLFAPAMSWAQSQDDKQGIKDAAINYVEGFYTNDSTRLAKGLHKDLVKRIIDNRSGTSKIQTIGLKDLVGYTKAGQKMPDKNPSEPFKAEVTIYDISNGIALAKVTTNKMDMFFDYMQLGKVNGTWQVINVLWAFTKP